MGLPRLLCATLECLDPKGVGVLNKHDTDIEMHSMPCMMGTGLATVHDVDMVTPSQSMVCMMQTAVVNVHDVDTSIQNMHMRA
jgi:hypothetical protein